MLSFFFFNDTATTEIYTLSLHDALPIFGFGKTEVAIRAAFKAVDNGKQVAVLVPTTILAFQHFKTFSERLSDLPVTVDYLNRFRTAKERRTVLEDLKSEIGRASCRERV